MKLKSAVLLLAFCISTTLIVVPVSCGPPYYHEEGNVNYPGSYFESTYVSRGIGVDDYISIIDLALLSRAYFTWYWEPWGIDWGFYNPDADINNDGVVQGRDLYIVARNWGLNYHDPPPSAESGLTKVKVKVLDNTIHVGEEFTVLIEIKAVTGLSVYEVKLSWDPELLMGVEAISGNFLPDPASNFGYFMGPNYIYVGGAMSSSDTVSGKGILAEITLRCIGTKKPPTTLLDLSSNLYDNGLYVIPHKDVDGSLMQLDQGV